MKTELERLKERIQEIERIQARCNHEWGEVIYEPQEKEIMRKELRGRMADMWYDLVPTGTYEQVPCWTRTCKKCEKKEYTYEQEEVVVKTIKQPKF